jgi:hypothetical protein
MQFLLSSDGTLKGTEFFIDGQRVDFLQSIKIILNGENDIIEIGMENDKLEEQMENIGYKKTEAGTFVKKE